MRGFTELLRTEAGQADRVAFLRRRRDELQEQGERIRAAIAVLDGKITHYEGQA